MEKNLPALQVTGLKKQYPGFSLGPVSLSLRPGSILGFIGRNGAGKTTTLRALLGMVRPEEGEISFFGRSFSGNELEIKEQAGFVSGGAEYYPRKKLRTITAVTRGFYPNWDEAAYQHYSRLFELSPEKTPRQLSAGMKVKYALTLALSHRARLLLLDEPTSGLDPVSREEILEIFNTLVRKEGVSILFSTHITSDLEKCADDIAYLHRGKLLFSGSLTEFRGAYRLISFTGEALSQRPPCLVGLKREKHGFSALLPRGEVCPEGWRETQASLDDLIVHLEREEKGEEEAVV